MSQQEYDYNELRAELRAEFHAELATMKEDFNRGVATVLEGFNARLRSLASEMGDLSAVTQRRVGFSEEYPANYKMITAQLFHNEPNLTGTRGGYHPSEWNIKVSFWTHSTNTSHYPNGTVQPYFFTLRSPDAVTNASPSSLLAEYLSIGAELIGCRSVKGTTKAKGTRLIQDQVVMVFPSTNEGKYPARTLLIASRHSNQVVALHDPFITPERDHKASKPVEKWRQLFD